MNEKYIGVTIGPVFDTVNMTSSPAALWAASYIFSKLTRTLCDVLMENGVEKDAILSPGMDTIDEIVDGVGLYHDRIIFKQNAFDIKQFAAVREEAVRRLAAAFFDQKDQKNMMAFLNSYLLIAAAAFEAENPLKDSGKILDSLELARPFATARETNPLLALFINSDAANTDEGEAEKVGANEAVKKLMEGFSEFQLKKCLSKDGHIVLKSLKDIAGNKKTGMKKHNYFAIVRSDGDSIGTLLSTLKTNNERRNFSADCLRFCNSLAKLVAKFEGVTIYAGGDDLLALLPCETSDSMTPFEFIAEANKCFGTYFKDNTSYSQAVRDAISLSFSVTMSYYKFPLYEALQTSQTMLFSHAKSIKNGAVIYLQKHSGQSEGLFVSNDALGEVIAFKNRITAQQDDVLMSALYKMGLFEKLLNGANNDEISRLFKNLFDNAAHTDNHFLHEQLPQIFQKLQNPEMRIFALDDNGIHTGETDHPDLNPVMTLCYLLRIGKFFIEKEGQS